MQHEGPVLEALTHRLAETPDDFLDEPRIEAKNAGRIHVAAVVHDLFRSRGLATTAPELQRFRGATSSDRNALQITLLLCWLLADEWFERVPLDKTALLELIAESARELAAQTPSRKFVADAERREELARLLLARLAFRPAGESQAQAEDRLTSLSTSERARVLRAAKQAEVRARQVREELARKAAQESADKWSRE
jgi:hypothetical protein